MPNNSNTTLIATACMADGTLLQASLPSFYVDDVCVTSPHPPLPPRALHTSPPTSSYTAHGRVHHNIATP
jgi:hypothetical protein